MAEWRVVLTPQSGELFVVMTTDNHARAERYMHKIARVLHEGTDNPFTVELWSQSAWDRRED